MNIKETESHYAFEVYPKRDLVIVRGDGAVLFSEDGGEFIDCAAGVGVANIGHAHPRLVKALADQAATLITCPGVLYNDKRAQLMERLVQLSPAGLEKVFLCNSGTESTEAAMKFSRHTTGKNQFVCTMRGFHGRTMGALSATFKYRDAFEPALPGFSFVPLNKIEKLERAIGDDTAAVMIELVQGEGGVRPADKTWVSEVRALCSERGILLIVDEVQTAFARTGAMFCCEHFDLTPDLLCLAKAIAGGMPMGAVLCSAAVKEAVGIHGSTFGGNPLAAAASLATLDIIEDENLCERASEAGIRLAESVRHIDAPVVREVRQLGLMVGIELKEKARPYIEKLLDHRVIALPAGPTVIRLLPPLVIRQDQIDAVVSALSDCLSRA